MQETGKEIDFWIVPEPKWLEAKYPKEAKMVKRPCVALISTDSMWITWVTPSLWGIFLVLQICLAFNYLILCLCPTATRFMKLRLDRVLKIELGPVSRDEALAVGGVVPQYPKPEKWTAPYSPYSPGWWEVFLPDQKQ